MMDYPADLNSALLGHLQQIVRDRDPFLATAGHFYVREYLLQQLSQWGEVERYLFEFRGSTYQNLILNLPAATLTARSPLLIGAHYDAVPGSPGADDNGTGLAVLLELARSIATQPLSYPVRIVAFDLEEYGLVGSTAYATQLRQNQEKLRLMLSLEMLGYCDATPGSQHYPAGLQHFYPKEGNFIGLIGNWLSIPDLLRLSRSMRRSGQACEWLPAGSRGRMVPDTRRSDHAPFWDQGYRAILVTDTANLRNPHYHTSRDRLETLDLEFLVCVCQGLISGVRDL